MVTKPKLKVLWVADYATQSAWDDNLKRIIISRVYDLEQIVKAGCNANDLESSDEEEPEDTPTDTHKRYTSRDDIAAYIARYQPDLIIYQIKNLEDYEWLPARDKPQILIYNYRQPGNVLIQPDNQRALYIYHTCALEVVKTIAELIGKPAASSRPRVIQLPAMAKRA